MNGSSSKQISGLRPVAVDQKKSGRFRQGARFVKRSVQTAPSQIRKKLVRVAYRLPGLSMRDPRRRVVRFKDVCSQTSSFPAAGAPQQNWYLEIRPPEIIERKESIALNPDQAVKFSNGCLKYQSGSRLTIPEVFLACLNKAGIYSRDFFILSHEKQILFESALSSQRALEENGALDTLLWPRSTALAGEYCILANRSCRAYYHWLIDVLPKLSIIGQFEHLKSVSLLLPKDLSPYHWASLELAGIPRERVTLIDAGYHTVDRVYFPEMLAPWGSISPHAVSWLRTHLLKKAELSPRGTGRRIYVSRRDANQRRVVNEEEIINYVSNLGFEVVCPGEMSLADQIALFSSVDTVIAPHGAGSTNMVFAPTGATLIEFFGDNYVNGCYWALTNICSQRHAFIIGPSTWLDYHIPLADLRRLLDRILER